MNKPKILLYDIETSPLQIHAWGLYEQNAISMVKDWELLSFAYKWLGEKTVKCKARPDFKDKTDKALTIELWELLDEADIIIAHNGDDFDNKKATAKFIEHGLVPPSHSQSVDTKKAAKRYFKFTSNKLDDLGRLLGVGRKKQTGGFELWLGCMAGDKKAWKKMCEYNKQDVALLERIYKKLLPWIGNHPNVLNISERPEGCPKCGSSRLQGSGVRVTRTGRVRRFRCMSCGGFCQNRVAEKGVKPGKVAA